MPEGKLYAIWAAVGPLVGVIIGGILAAWWQRRHWILDNKKVEYRELLDALHNYRWEVTRHQSTPGPAPIALNPTGVTAIAEALSSLWGRLADRIFIREALLNSTLHQELQNLHRSLVSVNPPTLDQWMKGWYELHGKLLRMAWKDLGVRKQFSKPEPLQGEEQHE